MMILVLGSRVGWSRVGRVVKGGVDDRVRDGVKWLGMGVEWMGLNWLGMRVEWMGMGMIGGGVDGGKVVRDGDDRGVKWLGMGGVDGGEVVRDGGGVDGDGDDRGWSG